MEGLHRKSNVTNNVLKPLPPPLLLLPDPVIDPWKVLIILKDCVGAHCFIFSDVFVKEVNGTAYERKESDFVHSSLDGANYFLGREIYF